jgi:predicted lipid-binding transport protein (Tim44 family)
MDALTIIFLALAVFVIWKLRSVLGQRTGHENRPPFDPMRGRENLPPSEDGKIVTLPQRSPPSAPREAAPAPVADRWADIAKPGTPLATGLAAIAAVDAGFDAKSFATGARTAYEMIVTAFAQGDRKTLTGLLSREVFEGFDVAMKDRESRGEKAETTFVAIDKAEIIDATLRDKQAQITMRFVSQLISATRDAKGQVVDGNPEKVAEVTDVWTFSRDTRNRDPNWLVVATEAAQ